jgi:hypothetical protein
LTIRIYDIGVVSIAIHVPFECQQLSELLPYHNPVTASGEALAARARQICNDVCSELKGLLVAPADPSAPEAYTVFCITELNGSDDAQAWFVDHRRQVAGLLAESEATRLSEKQVEDTLRIHGSFETRDLVVIDWDAALLVDLSGYVMDQLYVLELANLQLEEFRTLDQMLDRYLDLAYVDLGRRQWSLFGISSAALKVLRRSRIDLARLADEVTHITKFSGDWYLSRVYLGAQSRFHLEQWRLSVDERLATLDELYSVMHSDILERRMMWMEAAIIVLFLLDLAALVLLKQ